jgi:hypothetical protein
MSKDLDLLIQHNIESDQTLGSPPLPACFCTLSKTRFGSYFIWVYFSSLVLAITLAEKTSLKISTLLVHGAMNAVKKSAEKSELKSF